MLLLDYFLGLAAFDVVGFVAFMVGAVVVTVVLAVLINRSNRRD